LDLGACPHDTCDEKACAFAPDWTQQISAFLA
jgi:hypothetical protein